MTMIERVARALARKFNSYHFDRGDSDNGWEENMDTARAIIEELRVPTESMLHAADDTGVFAQALKGYTAMIDAALEETK